MERRFFDPRPTMGVLSELIHPLDLVRHLFLPVSSDTVYAQAVSSDLDVSGRPRTDSIDASFDVAGVPVLLHASYAWPERVRTVTALARSGDRLFRVRLPFLERVEPAREEAAPAPPAGTASPLAYALFTSGTTGEPHVAANSATARTVRHRPVTNPRRRDRTAPAGGSTPARSAAVPVSAVASHTATPGGRQPPQAR